MDGETALFDQLRNVAIEVAAATEVFPNGLDAILPFMDGRIRCFTVFAEQHLSTWFEDATHFSKGGFQIGNGTQGVGINDCINSIIFQRNGFRALGEEFDFKRQVIDVFPSNFQDFNWDVFKERFTSDFGKVEEKRYSLEQLLEFANRKFGKTKEDLVVLNELSWQRRRQYAAQVNASVNPQMKAEN